MTMTQNSNLAAESKKGAVKQSHMSLTLSGIQVLELCRGLFSFAKLHNYRVSLERMGNEEGSPKNVKSEECNCEICADRGRNDFL